MKMLKFCKCGLPIRPDTREIVFEITGKEASGESCFLHEICLPEYDKEGKLIAFKLPDEFYIWLENIFTRLYPESSKEEYKHFTLSKVIELITKRSNVDYSYLLS